MFQASGYIFGTKFDGLFQIFLRFREIVLTQIKCAEVVIRFSAVWLGCDDLLERGRGLVVVTALKECNAVGEIIAHKRAVYERSGKRKCHSQSLFSVTRNCCGVLDKLLRAENSLVRLYDCAILIEQE